MIARQSVASAFMAGALMIGLAACQKKDETTGQGPAEKAGVQIDRAATKAGEELNKAGEKAGELLQKAGEKGGAAVKEAGQKLENKSQEAQKSQEAPPKQ